MLDMAKAREFLHALICACTILYLKIHAKTILLLCLAIALTPERANDRLQTGREHWQPSLPVQMTMMDHERHTVPWCVTAVTVCGVRSM